jgi:hypothetical protein
VLDERTASWWRGRVRNLLNGLSALTTSTGTLSLFVDTTGGMLSFKILDMSRRLWSSQTRSATHAGDGGPCRWGQVLLAMVTQAKEQEFAQPCRRR